MAKNKLNIRAIISVFSVLIVLIITKISYDKIKKEKSILANEIKNNNWVIQANKHKPSIEFVKDSNLIIRDFNEAFVTYFLEPIGLTAEDYKDKDDYFAMDSISANKFRKVDSMALDCMCPVFQNVTVYYYGDTLNFIGTKYGFYLDNGAKALAGNFKLDINFNEK